MDAPNGNTPSNRRQDMYETPMLQVLNRGQAYFDSCYGKVAERVMTSLDHCGTEDLGLAVRLTYGYVLSPTAILSEAETSFVMIAGLIPQDVSSCALKSSLTACCWACRTRSGIARRALARARLHHLEDVRGAVKAFHGHDGVTGRGNRHTG